MMRYEIRIAGFGGQGVITAGYVLANATSIHDANYALMSQSYGPEARGGSCKSDVIVSNEPIDYPKTGRIDCLVALSIDAYSTFYRSVKSNGLIIHEEDLVEIPLEQQRDDVEYYAIPAVEAAREIGNVLTANMIMLGALQEITDKVSLESLRLSVIDRFPKYKDINLLAIEKGVELAKAAMEEDSPHL
jgi:2-oxoglutarate ferredoxin oxidoreductase subunit gamma